MQQKKLNRIDDLTQKMTLFVANISTKYTNKQKQYLL